MAANAELELDKALVNFAKSLPYSEADIKRAKEHVDKLRIDKWKESIFTNKISGVSRENVGQYILSLKPMTEGLDSDAAEEIIATIRNAQFSNGSSGTLCRFEYDNGKLDSKKGIIAFALNTEDQTLSFVIAIHCLKFKASEQRYKRPKKFFLCIEGTEEDVRSNVKFSANDIRDLVDAYCVYRALKGIHSSGLKALPWLK